MTREEMAANIRPLDRYIDVKTVVDKLQNNKVFCYGAGKIGKGFAKLLDDLKVDTCN